MGFGAAVFFRERAPNVAQLESQVRAVLSADTLDLETTVQLYVHPRAQLTAVVLADDRLEPFGLLEPLAISLGRMLRLPTWSYSEFVNAEWWIGVAAFDSAGEPLWSQESEDDEPAPGVVARVVHFLGGRRQSGRALPYWRMAADWGTRKQLFDYGLEPVLDLANQRGWNELGRVRLEFSTRHRSAIAEREAAAARRELEARAAAEVERQAEREAAKAAAAARRVEAKLEARRLMDRHLVPGEPKEVPLPSGLHELARKLCAKHTVELGWVWQAAAAAATPWRFPTSALAEVPLTEPEPAVLVVSPDLSLSLSKSSVVRPDGTPGTFEELVRVAIAVGLDQLAEDLREDERKRKKLR